MHFNTKNENGRSQILIFFILVGLALRVLGILFFPPGMEGDEVVVVYWGRKWITEGHWNLISFDELPAWETPSAYIFGALDLLKVNPRWGAVVISFLEIGMCYLWTKKKAGKDTALVATSFLSLMPWHFYFSYVLGPCVAGFWTSLYLLDIQNPVGRVLGNLGGIFYYVTYRLILLWGGLTGLLRRQWKKVALDSFSVIIALFILLFFGVDQFKGFFVKGSYLVTERGPLEWAHHYINSILLWWVPPLQEYWNELAIYSSADVGFGMANSLGFQSPLSFGTSLFFALGIFFCLKKKYFRELVALFFLSVLLVGFSPSYVHFPFILPVVAFIAAVGARELIQSRRWGFIVIASSLLFSGLSVVYLMLNLKGNDRWNTYHDYSNAVASEIHAINAHQAFVWTSGYDYYRSRLAADRVGMTIVPFDLNLTGWLTAIKQDSVNKKTRWVFIQNRTEVQHPRPEIAEVLRISYEDTLKRYILFERNNSILNKKTIVINGTDIGVLYELEY